MGFFIIKILPYVNGPSGDCDFHGPPLTHFTHRYHTPLPQYHYPTTQLPHYTTLHLIPDPFLSSTNRRRRVTFTSLFPLPHYHNISHGTSYLKLFFLVARHRSRRRRRGVATTTTLHHSKPHTTNCHLPTFAVALFSHQPYVSEHFITPSDFMDRLDHDASSCLEDSGSAAGPPNGLPGLR